MIQSYGIYKITNLINGKIYIGQASDLTSRKKNHFSQLNRKVHSNIHLQRSVNKYGINNFVFEVIEFCEEEKLTELEQKYVDENPEAYNICRICVGSRRGVKASEDVKKQMSISRKGKPSPKKGTHLTEEQCQKISERQKGKKKTNIPIVTEETKLKQSIAHKGKKLSPATKQKLAEISTGNHYALGYKHTEEAKRKLSVANTGRVVSEETRELISIIHTGMKHTEETKKKLSEINTGKVLSEETKAKISLAQKDRVYSTVNMIFISPEGIKYSTQNLSCFCRDNNLARTSMKRVFLGRTEQHRGWRKFLDKEE